MQRIGLGLALVAALAAPSLGGELTKKGFRKLKQRTKAALAQGDADALAEALAGLGQDDSRAAVDLVLKSALALPKGKVLRAATEALASMDSPEAQEALCARLQKKGGHPHLKILCIDALAGREDKASGEALGAALADKRPEVLRAALRAIRARKPVEAVDGLIDLFERLQRRPDQLLQRQVDYALAEITGKYFETAEDWRKFWELRKASFRPRTGGSLPAGLTTSERNKRPTFFGSEIASDRLVFVIDTSGSMKGDRLAKCKQQLAECIDALSPRSRFTIIGFSSSLRVWNKRLVQASPANKQKAKAFAQALQAAGNTFTLTALKNAFEVQGADAIVLLSDGMPTETNNKGETLTTDFILDEVDAQNRFKKWRIDTFGFEVTPGGSLSAFMRALAKQHGGTFTPIR
ncbi:MAG: VWA domain-containing protein [Planctomycetota bacterium]|nr:MAG: VWA domain-containing protein [Planctomycetota bacterium]